MARLLQRTCVRVRASVRAQVPGNVNVAGGALPLWLMEQLGQPINILVAEGVLAPGSDTEPDEPDELED